MTVSDEQHYPPAPWRLRGQAIVAVRLVPETVARSLVPAEVRIVCVRPGSTIAVLYLSRYRDSPVGEYHEAIVAPALARIGGKPACWISHIVVDSEAATIAGRAIWDLPKHAASFQWLNQRSSRVAMNSAQFNVQVQLDSQRARVRLPFAGPAMSRLSQVIKRFYARGSARMARARASVELSGDPRLEQLGFGRLKQLFVLDDMRLTIGAPSQLRSDRR
jgi:hypothetical protein